MSGDILSTSERPPEEGRVKVLSAGNDLGPCRIGPINASCPAEVRLSLMRLRVTCNKRL